MTRAEVLANYRVENGRIVSPGKFEGEMLYVPALWDMVMDGCYDGPDNDGAAHIDIDDAMIAAWPELAEYSAAELIERSDGFVLCYLTERV